MINFSKILLCKINYIDIFDAIDLFQIFMEFRNTEILIDSSIFLRIWGQSLKNQNDNWKFEKLIAVVDLYEVRYSKFYELLNANLGSKLKNSKSLLQYGDPKFWKIQNGDKKFKKLFDVLDLYEFLYVNLRSKFKNSSSRCNIAIQNFGKFKTGTQISKSSSTCLIHINFNIWSFINCWMRISGQNFKIQVCCYNMAIQNFEKWKTVTKKFKKLFDVLDLYKFWCLEFYKLLNKNSRSKFKNSKSLLQYGDPKFRKIQNGDTKFEKLIDRAWFI